VLFDGGTAYNNGLVDALEEEFMRDFIVPEEPQITTAIGAAHMAMDICLKVKSKTSTSPTSSLSSMDHEEYVVFQDPGRVK